MNNFTSVVKSKALKAISDYSMLCDTRKIVVGLSGGADSVCLLHTLNSLKDEFDFELVGAHVNHGIRGDEALRDADFARDFCQKLGIEFKLLNIDCVKLSKETGDSLEVCGRNERYKFFNSLIGDDAKIATAHNANDNAETVLFNIARGSTIKGGGGIPPVRDSVIRPLIYCTRKEIEGYCDENGLSYVTDSTNLADDYTRNKIRHMILPVLEEINTEAISNFTYFSSNARETSEYIKRQALFALDRSRGNDSDYFVGALLDFDEVVVREALVVLFRDWSDKTLERKKLDELIALLNSSGRIQVYGDIFAEVVKGKFRFFVNGKQAIPEAISIEKLPFEAVLGDYLIKSEVITESSEKFNKKVLDNLIDCDKIIGKVFLRTRVVGDKISLRDRGVTKTLKKLFSEMNIPVEKRDFIPVLCDDEGVVWVYSVGVDARCHVDNNSSNIIFIGGKNND